MEAFMANQNSVHPVKAILIANFRTQSRNALFLALVWLVATIALATFCQFASAQPQQYSALEVAEKYRTQLPPYNADEETIASYKKDNRDAERNQRDSYGKVRDILTGSGNVSDPIINEYFNGFEFPYMTTLDNRVLSQLGERRTKFIKDFLNSNVSGGVRSGFIDLTIAATQKICADSSLHPAARLNAVYLMGMLDQIAPVRSPLQLPVPSTAAFDSLRKILDSTDDKSFPNYLKVAALAGIQRHVEIDRLVGNQIAAADKQALLQKAAAFLDDPKNDDLSYWLKRRGMQLIGLIGDPRLIDRVIAVLTHSKRSESSTLPPTCWPRTPKHRLRSPNIWPLHLKKNPNRSRNRSTSSFSMSCYSKTLICLKPERITRQTNRQKRGPHFLAVTEWVVAAAEVLQAAVAVAALPVVLRAVVPRVVAPQVVLLAAVENSVAGVEEEVRAWAWVWVPVVLPVAGVDSALALVQAVAYFQAQPLSCLFTSST
jgi:hypothetical protein